MIKVNLLPPGVRPSKAAALALAIPWKKVGVASGALLVSVSLFFLGGNILLGRRVTYFTTQLQELEPQHMKLEETQLKLQALQIRAAAIDSIKAREGQWAPRLNLLTDALVRDLWFVVALFMKGYPSQTEEFVKTELEQLQLESFFQVPEQFKKMFETPEGSAGTGEGSVPLTRPVLLLGGVALMPGEGSESPVTRFLVRLKEQPAFAQWFSGLELKDIAQASDSKESGGSAFLISMYPTGS